MSRHLPVAAAALAVLAAGAASAQAPATAPAATPAPAAAKVFKAPNVTIVDGQPPPTLSGYFEKDYTRDYKATPAGVYRLSPVHAAIVAKIGHDGGISWSAFGFGKVKGTINWNPADITSSSVDATVDVTDIRTPVPGFAEELKGEHFLNTAKFPTATFVSTGATMTTPTTGVLHGNMTLMGVTKPVDFNVVWVAGVPSGAGLMNLGFNAVGHIKRSDFGFKAAIPSIGDDVVLEIDMEAALGRGKGAGAG